MDAVSIGQFENVPRFVPAMTDLDHLAWRSDFPGCRVSSDAKLGAGVGVGVGSVVYPGVEIGDGTSIGEYCILGHGAAQNEAPLAIGASSTIRSFSVIYSGNRFGSRLETGHHVVIRERTQAGENLRIGNFSDIEGHCVIGDYCRFHGYTHVGKGSQIGHFVWLYSLTTATNDPLPPSSLAEPVVIEDGAVVCVGATLMPGVRVGKGAFVSAGTLARGEIPSGAVVSGLECRIVSHVSQLIHLDSGTRHPWMRHFAERFPPESHARLAGLLSEIQATRQALQIDPI